MIASVMQAITYWNTGNPCVVFGLFASANQVSLVRASKSGHQLVYLARFNPRLIKQI